MIVAAPCPEAPNTHTCPERFRGGIERYLAHRIAPGSFLRAVLENDLMGAVGHADEESARELQALVRWLWQEMPSNLWGSKERVAAWLKPGKGSKP